MIMFITNNICELNFLQNRANDFRALNASNVQCYVLLPQ